MCCVALVNAARLYGINPRQRLNERTEDSLTALEYLEEKTIKQGRSLKDMTLGQMEEIWQEAKCRDKE
jgi:XTP/dITP diphosphohydrolase